MTTDEYGRTLLVTCARCAAYPAVPCALHRDRPRVPSTSEGE